MHLVSDRCSRSINPIFSSGSDVMVALLKRPMRIDSQKGAERRIFPRKEVQAAVEGKRIDHTIEARRTPAFQLHLRDLSFGGLSALSPMPLDRGERLSIAIPALGPAGGWDAC